MSSSLKKHLSFTKLKEFYYKEKQEKWQIWSHMREYSKMDAFNDGIQYLFSIVLY